MCKQEYRKLDFLRFEKYSSCEKAYPPEGTGMNCAVIPQGVC